MLKENMLFKSNDDRVPVGVAKYGFADWDRKRGNHRALVRVNASSDIVCAYLPWRRRDAYPQAKHVMVVDAQTDQVVANVVVATCNKEYGEILFKPTSGTGEYYIYYLIPEEDPYGATWPRSSFPIIQYKRPQNQPEESWLAAHGLTREALETTTDPRGWHLQGGTVYATVWREFKLTELVEFQARGERHSFYPMEVVATLDETNALEHACRFQPFILFPELRSNPIRMTDALPYCWAIREHDQHASLSDTVLRNEYYVFQIGVFASKTLLKNVKADYTGLTSELGGTISADAFTCFNLEGVDQHGNNFTKTIDVEYRKVQALWFGLDIRRDAKPGRYTGTVTVHSEGEQPQTVSLSLEIQEQLLEDRGDGDHRRLSRLRWLNSRIAVDDDICPPFTPLSVRGNTVGILGRKIELGDLGMAGQITSFIDMFDIRERGQAVLREPVAFEIIRDGKAVAFTAASLECTRTSPGIAHFVSTAASGPMTVRVATTVEMDGFIGHVVTVDTETPVSVDGIRLRLPFTREASRYFMHQTDMTIDQVSQKTDFGRTPDAEWSYPAERFELLWLGAHNAGLCLRVPPGQGAWVNDGNGTVARRSEADGCTITLDTGPMVIDKQASFAFELYATPFKPLSRNGWKMRHYHESYSHDVEILKGQSAGATVFTYHHANRTNPYISYPFLLAAELKAAGDVIHAGGGLMKAYYTIRELSDRASELWTLLSLGNEILMASDTKPGYPSFHLGYDQLSQLPIEYQLRNQVGWPYTGNLWQCEHLVSKYHSRWHSTVNMGDYTTIDGSLQISGASRWSNFYMEGMKWLMENAGLDGIYLDGITFDRESFKRVRKTLVRTKAEGLIDYHSSPAAIAQMPYFDRLWFGEGADYGREADYWLVAVSGIPFGVGGEMLKAGASVHRGMLFGISNRFGWSSPKRVNPACLWQWWDEFDIANAEMMGYWQDACPAKTNHAAVKATAYVHRGERVALAIASWADEQVDIKLDLDWDAIGLDPRNVTISVPEIAFFQDKLSNPSLDSIPVDPGKGWIIVIERKG